MRYLIFALIGIFSISFAKEIDGYAVYKKYCAACHIEKISMETMKEIEKAVKSRKKPPLKAPPFMEVSARIKHFYPNKEDFIKFVVDYITNPSYEKAKCLPMALKKLGLMPPIGKSMKEEEKVAVAKWLYENFHKKWEDFPMAKKESMMQMKMHKCDKNCKCKMHREE